jgi:hypothetical protein
MSENGHHEVAPVAEVAISFLPLELTWLVAKLEEVTIPSVQGKMLAASIQQKAEQAIAALAADE